MTIPCPDCGYDLAGSREMRCPECGKDLAGWADHWPAMISQDIFLESRFFGLLLNVVNLLAINAIAAIALVLAAWMVARRGHALDPALWLGGYAFLAIASGQFVGWRTCRVVRTRFCGRRRWTWAVASLACSPLPVALWLAAR